MSEDTTTIYECVEAFAADLDGTPVSVVAGERVRAGHKLLQGRMMFFRPLTVKYEVERATAKPGEKRGERS